MIAASGSLTITLLAYLTPLPLFILGLSGKNHFAGVAGALAALLLFAAATPMVAVVYFFLVVLPVTLFCDSATQMRGRANLHGTQANLSSASVGHLCAQISITPALLLTMLFVYFLFQQNENTQALLSKTAESIMVTYQNALIEKNVAISPEVGKQIVVIKNTLVNTAPALIGIFWMTLFLINAMIARHVLNRFTQTFPIAFKLSQIELPHWVIITFISSGLMAAVLDGEIGLYSTNLAAIIAFPILLSGLGVIHLATEKTGYKKTILFSVYTIILISRWAALLLIFIGMIDHFIKIKAKIVSRSAKS
tara:strand:+ start:413 stop:1336 length:924 start_codon:yes stop_codon:yes gene_type:complete